MLVKNSRLRLLAPILVLCAFSPNLRGDGLSLPLVPSGGLAYEGSFRLPAWTGGDESFGYAGTGLAFNPLKNSLFMTGHEWYQKVAEVSIPEVRKTSQLAGLATATYLQSFYDPTDGKIALINPSDPNSKKIGGFLPYRGKLYVSAYAYYDAANTQVLSHFVSGTDLSAAGDVTGPYQVGDVGAGFVSGYFAEVPSALQGLLGGPVAVGNCCLAIVARTSSGPALFTINPLDLGTKSPAPAIPLVYYPMAHPLSAWESTSSVYNGTTSIRGVVIPAGTRSVLFFGRQGVGPFCYGGAECNDPGETSKGTHAYPYISQVWAYDALDLAEVRAGRKQPWEVRPYATWRLPLPAPGSNGVLNGAAYDPATGRIFVAQAFADSDQPLVHVFSIAGGTASTIATPTAPINLRIVK